LQILRIVRGTGGPTKLAAKGSYIAIKGEQWTQRQSLISLGVVFVKKKFGL